MAAAKKMDAITLLKTDHRKVEDLFDKFEAARGEAKKKSLASQICLELTIHAKIEEEVFYPACKEVAEGDIWQESIVEHDSAKVLIAEIEAGNPGDEFYDAKVKVLSEIVRQHIKEEEKRSDGMFAQARKGGLDMGALGEEMAELKKELMSEYKSSGLPKPPTSSFTETRIS
jgi:hemerythrin superfamily protein